MMNSVEILDKKSQLKNRCKEIVSLCKAEIREMTEDEKQEFDSNKEEIKKLNDELDELKKRLAEYDDEIPEDEEKEEDKEENKSNKNKRSTMEKKYQFSLLKAIKDVAEHRSLDPVSQAVVNAGAEEMRKAGRPITGEIQLPLNERSVVTVTSEHDDVVQTDFMDLLGPLRAKNVLVQAGAKYLTGLSNDVQVPIMSANQVGWAGEIETASDSSIAFTSVTLQPKRLTAYIDISKQFLIQTDSIGAEEMIRQDLIAAINDKLEKTILGYEDGSTTKPAGMFYDPSTNSNITNVSTFKGVCELEANLEDANVIGQPVYVMSNKAKAVVRSMDKGGKHTELVYENGELDGTYVYTTSNVPNKLAIYGDFNNLVIGQWGSLDLTIDSITQVINGKVRITVTAWFDAKVVRPEAFTYASFE